MSAVGFRDRRDAGCRLAARLAGVGRERPVVVGLPRGGVPVASEVAHALGAPLDVILVRKLGVPSQPELAMGALGEGGVRVLNRDVIESMRVSAVDLARVEAAEAVALERRARRLRGSRPVLPLRGRTVVIVDDGLATGATARAAIEVARASGAHRIVLAVPVAPPETVRALAEVADDVVALVQPRVFGGVGRFYDDFAPTTDDEVTELLAAAPGPAAPDGTTAP